MTFRVLHFSDVHVPSPLDEMRIKELLGKRIIGLTNLRLRRSSRFKDAAMKLESLAAAMPQLGIDFALCTGDFTALGTRQELETSRKAVDAFRNAPRGFAVVPGNHDLYLKDSISDGRFTATFGDLARGDRPEAAVDQLWPAVWTPNDDVAVVAVNSARPNPQVWLSSGRIPEAQLKRLEAILAEPDMQRRFVIIATHYAARASDGGPDAPRHGLDNADAFLGALSPLSRGLLAFGHIHHRYSVRVPECPVRLFGAGSATQAGHEGAWIYEIDGESARAIPGSWSGQRYEFDEAGAIDIAT